MKNTFPAGMLKLKSLKICMSGLVGYLKLICWSSILPSITSNVMPSLLLESILGLLSSISNIEAAAPLLLLRSEGRLLRTESPIDAIVKAKMTCKRKLFREL